MPGLKVKTSSLIDRKQPYPTGVGSAPQMIRAAGGPAAAVLASALEGVEGSLNYIHKTLRQNAPEVHQIQVTDSAGKVIAALGEFIFAGVPATNYFSEIHAGDPLNTGDPSQALFNANPDGSVTIGQSGWLDVLDPYGGDAAWIGTQFDTLPVSGAANNGAGLIRLEVIGHTLQSGDVARVRGVLGVTAATDGTSNANGVFSVTVVDANHVDLQNSVFVGSYISGGAIDRLLHIAGVANNGSGLARITTAVAHNYESGDKVHLQNVGSGLDGQWIIKVIDSTHFDLVGSSFAGGTNGTALRYFAGMLAQTFAIGPSFSDYRLRGFADGSLRLKGATFSLTTNGSTISISDQPVPGVLAPGVDVKDNVNLWHAVHTAKDFAILDPTGTVVADLALNGAAGDSGELILQNPAQTVSLTLDGSTGTMSLSSASGTKLAQVSSTALAIDPGATPGAAQIALKANGNGVFSAYCYASDNAGLGLDAELLAGTWVARNATIAAIFKNGGLLRFVGSSGNVVGGVAALLTRGSMDPTTGQWRFGDAATASYTVDSAGDVNASGVFRIGGTQVVRSRLGAVAGPVINTTTITGTAGATYTATEQGMINNLETAVNQLNADVVSLQGVVNTLIARLQAHGLTA